jgi:hypothetical protein
LLFVQPIFIDLYGSAPWPRDQRRAARRWSEAIDFIYISFDQFTNVAWFRIPKPLRDVRIQSAGLAVEVR